MFQHQPNRQHFIFHLIIVFALVTGACQLFSGTPTAVTPTQEIISRATPVPATAVVEPGDTPQPTQPVTLGKAGPPLRFANFNEPPVRTEGRLPAYTVEPGLKNVYQPFLLSPQQLAQLEQSGFVVSPGQEKEFFTVYEKARYANVPIFITSDSLLHTYHLMFDKVLRTAETTYFIPMLRDLNAVLLATTDQQYQALQSTDWADAALRSVAYLGVASRLLNGTVQLPAYASDLADQELALIEAAGGMQSSPIFP